MATHISYSDLLRRALIVVAAALVPILVWYLFDVILIAFGAVVLAMLLRLGAAPLVRRLSVPEPIALIVSGLIILFVIGGTGYLFGTRLAGQLQDVMQRVSDASTGIRQMLESSDFGKLIMNHLSGENFSLSGVLKVSTTFLEAVIIMLISGVYLGAQPHLYRRGLIHLFPRSKHARAAEIVDGVGEALRLWLLGQLIEMILIGVLAALAMWAIGVPSPFALGLIAGVGEFIPYLGPILAAIPAVLVALTKSPEATLWTIFAYLVIHQIEGQIVAPIIQRHMVAIPPAVMLLGIVAITYLFGAIAIIFAAPICVVVFAVVNLLYVRDALGDKTELTRKIG